MFHREWLAEHYNPRGEVKATFDTFALAQERADEINQGGEKRPTHAYKCGYCDAFHVGHNNPKKRRR